MRFRLLTLFALFSSLLPAQPLPFSNPHPLSIAHFNPTMEGDGEQQGVYFRETSFFENRGYLADGNIYHFTIDMEVSELLYRTRQSFGRWSVSANFTLAAAHKGFFDQTINSVHDHLGYKGGVFDEKKAAPDNEFNFFITDANGTVIYKEDPRIFVNADIFISTSPWKGGVVRLGIRPTFKQDFAFYQDYSEFSLTYQHRFQWKELDFFADYSLITVSPDDTGFKQKTLRTSYNFYLAWNRWFVQTNRAESVYKSGNEKIDSHGAIFSLGWHGESWSFAMTEDFSPFNRPDVSIVIGYRF